MKLRLFPTLLALACLAGSPGTRAGSLVIFGDSLSDTGNNAFVFDAAGASQGVPPGTLRSPVPTPDNTFIPTLPYATPVGGRYSNGPVWAESFAQSLGLSAVASNLGGTDYAYGGARVGPLGPVNPFQDFPQNFPLSLTTQVATFLLQHPQAPADALYIVEGGGNDARDIIQEAGQDIMHGVNPLPDILAGAASYADYVNDMVDELQTAGANNIVVWNTPNLGVAPAIIASGASDLGSEVASLMNQALDQDLTDEITKGARIFDAYGLVTYVTEHPQLFGLAPDVTDACSAMANIDACQQADFRYFFWDGIHPTTAGQEVFAHAMLEFVPEPVTIALVGVAFAAMGLARRRKPD
ncbi:MAG TPA: SGNH/GDSL hydrolase family protein [Burkholderiales bacterium]|nr:SGNH/GDSL hydrolase family protein [Burkholderiales bacterium]